MSLETTDWEFRHESKGSGYVTSFGFKCAFCELPLSGSIDVIDDSQPQCSRNQVEMFLKENMELCQECKKLHSEKLIAAYHENKSREMDEDGS